MSKVDDELTRRLRGAERPVDGDNLFEGLERRRARRESLRKAQTGFLALVVVAATVGSFLALSLAFRHTPNGPAVSPFPILPKENGLLAYADGSSLYTVSASDGSDISRIRGIPNGAWLPAWSPDGTKLAAAVFPGQGPREIWTVDADGSDARKLAEADNVSRPGWSPDGSRLVYAADTAAGSAVHVINLDGTGDHIVGEVAQDDDYFSAAFSPDGTQILYDRGTDVGFAIFVMSAEGESPTNLSQSDQDYSPAWSPDGTAIVFARQEDSMESDIFVMDADGTNVRRLTDGPFGDTNLYPTFSPDGTKIAYVSGQSGGPGGLLVMDADGRSPRTLVKQDVLGISWQPVPAREPSKSPTPTPEPAGRDIGLGFNLCHVQRLGGIDFLGDGTAGIAWVGTRTRENGSCPPEGGGSRGVVAADFHGDEIADSWWDGIEYCLYCEPFDATDLDADGDEELVVLESNSTTPAYLVLTIQPDADGRAQLRPVVVAAPGHDAARLPAGDLLTIVTGGDEGFSGWVRCEGFPVAPVLVLTWRDHPIEGATMEVHETKLDLREDGAAHVIETNDYSAPVGTPIPGVSDAPACGVDWQILD